ncbi:GSCOCT00014222001.2-RA-CDS [Cotesia congregata]|uniref:Cc_bv5.5_25.5b n=1 Tax=Cotesia congregata TaxID=51543 RepID=S6CWE9_COTCN|nr:GSCOCT00014222001.2-RA-CDS [Cotesia congregata]CAG5092329.1 cc_bv5.5_25.5b [Cotesia congregata]CCQ71082.1 hypothetical protein BV5-5 [Cotesia congregata]
MIINTTFSFTVFPNGCSTGLAYAKSRKMAGMSSILDGMGTVMDFVHNIIPGSNSNQQYGGKPQVIYGSVTNTKGNHFRNTNIKGSISYGSNTVQTGNRYE